MSDFNKLVKYVNSSKKSLEKKLNKSGYVENMGQKELRKVEDMVFSIVHDGWGFENADIKQNARVISNDFRKFVENL